MIEQNSTVNISKQDSTVNISKEILELIKEKAPGAIIDGVFSSATSQVVAPAVRVLMSAVLKIKSIDDKVNALDNKLNLVSQEINEIKNTLDSMSQTTYEIRRAVDKLNTVVDSINYQIYQNNRNIDEVNKKVDQMLFSPLKEAFREIELAVLYEKFGQNEERVKILMSATQNLKKAASQLEGWNEIHALYLAGVCCNLINDKIAKEYYYQTCLNKLESIRLQLIANLKSKRISQEDYRVNKEKEDETNGRFFLGVMIGGIGFCTGLFGAGLVVRSVLGVAGGIIGMCIPEAKIIEKKPYSEIEKEVEEEVSKMSIVNANFTIAELKQSLESALV